MEWAQQGKNVEQLLGESEFAIAKGWLLEAKHKQPAPYYLQQEFIGESQYAITVAEEKKERELEKRVEIRTAKLNEQLSAAHLKSKLWLAVSSLALVIVVGVSWYAVKQNQIAQQAQKSVQQQAEIAQQTLKRAKDSEELAFQKRIRAENCEKEVQQAQAKVEICEQKLAKAEKGETISSKQTSTYDETDWEIFRDRLQDGTEGPEMV